MAFSRPTLSAIVSRVESDTAGALGLTLPVLSRAVVRVLSRAVAGASHMLHGHIEFLVRQIFPQTQERDYLIRDAEGYGLSPTEATYATGLVGFAGTNGTVVPSGTLVSRPDGARYEVETGGTVSGGAVSLTVTAVTAGAEGDTDDGAVLALVTPIAGITGATVNGGLTGGGDEESTEDFRARVLEAMRAESLGGADSDWTRWAKEVPGVTRAWVYRHEQGLGTVTVRFVRDGDVSVFPDAGEVAAVQAKLDAERPTTADPIAEAPTDLPMPVTLTITPDTPELRSAVEIELRDLLTTRAEPGDGAGRGTILLSEVRTAIGVISPDYTMTSPAVDVIPGVGQLVTLGSLTWI